MAMDPRRPKIDTPWARIPLDLMFGDFTDADKRVYAALCWLSGARGHWYGPQSDIIDTAKVAERSVRRAIETLRDAGYIETEDMGLKYNNVLRYFILSRPVDAPDVEPEFDAEDGLSSRPLVAPGPATDGRDERPRVAATSFTTETTPQKPTIEATTARARAVRAVEALIPGGITRTVGEGIGDHLAAGADPGWFELAVAEAERASVRRWDYVDAILNRYHREGFGPRKERAHGRTDRPSSRVPSGFVPREAHW